MGIKKSNTVRVRFFWCSERDSNPHDFRHTPLKRTCLPIPPPEQLSIIEHPNMEFFFGLARKKSDFLIFIFLCSNLSKGTKKNENKKRLAKDA